MPSCALAVRFCIPSVKQEVGHWQCKQRWRQTWPRFVSVVNVPFKRFYTINMHLSSKIAIFKIIFVFVVCYFDIEMLVVCVDIDSSVGWSIDIERSSNNPYTTHRALALFLVDCGETTSNKHGKNAWLKDNCLISYYILVHSLQPTPF